MNQKPKQMNQIPKVRYRETPCNLQYSSLNPSSIFNPYNLKSSPLPNPSASNKLDITSPQLPSLFRH